MLAKDIEETPSKIFDFVIKLPEKKKKRRMRMRMGMGKKVVKASQLKKLSRNKSTLRFKEPASSLIF